MGWQEIPAITALRAELDQVYPNRVRPDWVIGDADHSSRDSDHNPAPDGDVHAVDIRLGSSDLPGLNLDGTVPAPVRRLLAAVVGDVRVWYVIFNGKIYSRTYDWAARVYTGRNPHRTHVHVSFRYEPEFEQMTGPYFGGKKTRTRPVPIDLSVIRHEFLKALDLREGDVEPRAHVRRVQRALNERTGANLTVDGLVGRKTLNAWGRWERQPDVPGRGRPRVPDVKSLGALVAPRWRAVP